MNPTIEVLINQTPYRLPVGACLSDAISAAGVQPPFAAAVNLEFVPKTRHHNHPLSPGDRIELIAPITGG
ncbi:MAG: sulfur carrier protein ThiS [Pseudomonadota bacterium]|jgi:sulfur carrier protein